MSPLEIVAILALTGYALYRQTRVSEVHEKSRFKLAITYGIVGLAIGGFVVPRGDIAWGFLLLSILLSVVVGVARGYRTKVWLDGQRILTQGTALTVTLFLGLIAAKFAIGTAEYFDDVPAGAGFGEVMVMIAVMVAVQAEIVWRRGTALLASAGLPVGEREGALR